MPPTTTPTKPRAATPAASPTAATGAVLESLDPKLVDVASEFNPRTSMDDEQLRELTTSVKSVGVLQPITVVRTAEKDRFRLVVGHRRLAAALAAKSTAVPALVYDAIDDASRLQFAIIENLQREDMNPIDEAAAYQRAISQGSLTQKQLAGVIGKSASHVSERLRLLKLPDLARTAIADGRLPLAAAKPLGMIAALKVPTAAEIAEWVASNVLEDEQLLDDLIDDPSTTLYAVASDDAPEGAPFLHRVNSYSRRLPLKGHVEDAVIATLDERMDRLGMRSVTFDQADIDAARAYGCLIELESRYTTQRFVTDPEFLVSRLNDSLDLLDKRRAEREAERAKHSNVIVAAVSGGTSTASGGDAPGISLAALAVDRKREREQAEKTRVAAIHANRDLGVRLMKQLGAHKFDRASVELLARIVLTQNGTLAARGLAYTHEDFHTLTTTRQKNGKLRTSFETLDEHQARQRAAEWIMRPRSAEEVLGRLLQTLVAGVFADELALPKSKRPQWTITAPRRTEPIIAKLARKLLPEHFHARAERLLPPPPTKKQATRPKAEAKVAAPKAKAKTKAKASTKAPVKATSTRTGAKDAH